MSTTADDDFFLTTFTDIWLHLTLWATATACVIFFLAGLWAARVAKTRLAWVWAPISYILVGGIACFVQASIVAALVAAIYRAIPYSAGLDTTSGLGVGIGIIFVYFHLGRSDFIHR